MRKVSTKLIEVSEEAYKFVMAQTNVVRSTNFDGRLLDFYDSTAPNATPALRKLKGFAGKWHYFVEGDAE